jgi:hypothetical protein
MHLLLQSLRSRNHPGPSKPGVKSSLCSASRGSPRAPTGFSDWNSWGEFHLFNKRQTILWVNWSPGSSTLTRWGMSPSRWISGRTYRMCPRRWWSSGEIEAKPALAGNPPVTLGIDFLGALEVDSTQVLPLESFSELKPATVLPPALSCLSYAEIHIFSFISFLIKFSGYSLQCSLFLGPKSSKHFGVQALALSVDWHSKQSMWILWGRYLQVS